jgi:hypothetical protein
MVSNLEGHFLLVEVIVPLHSFSAECEGRLSFFLCFDPVVKQSFKGQVYQFAYSV